MGSHSPFRTRRAGPRTHGRGTRLPAAALLEFRWGPDTLRLEVAARGTGRTLTLLHTFGEHGKAARDAAGWHVCLDALASHLDGNPRRRRACWAQVDPGYVSSFGPEASATGVPAGHQPG